MKKLRAVSKASDLNVEWFQDMFDLDPNNTQKVTSVNLLNARNDVIGYLSEMNFIEVKTGTKAAAGDTSDGAVDDQESIYNLVIKREPSSEVFHAYCAAANGFQKEAWVYGELQPKLELFLKEMGGNLRIPFCKSFYVEEGEGKFMLVMENLIKAGYQPLDLEKIRSGDGLDVDELRAVFNALAEFHGATIAYREVRGVDFSKMPLFDDLFAHPDKMRGNEAVMAFNKDCEEVGHYILSLVEEKYGSKDNDGYKLIKKMFSDIPQELYKNWFGPTGRKELFTVCHADLDVRNFMVKHDVNGQISELCMFDWQILQYCSLTLDLQYFLGISSSRPTRKKHLKSLLEFYFKRLGEVTQMFGISLDQLGIKYENFVADFKWRMPLRFFCGTILFVMLAKDPENAVDESEMMKLKIESIRGTKMDQTMLDLVNDLLNGDDDL